MKKLILTAAVVTLAFCSYAQGISGGLKAGLNFANQKFSSSGFSISPDARTSFHFGGYLNVAFSDALSLQPELLYNSVGSKFDDGEYKLSYLSVPVMLKWNPVPIFNLQAGPQVGFLLSAEDDDGTDIKDGFKGLDLGFGLGAGVDLPMGLNFNVRYILGLGNVAESDPDLDDFTVKNNVFQVSVGYTIFGLKK